METTGPRTGPRRKADALEKLEATHADVWVATANASGDAHLVPLSFALRADRVMLITAPDSVTARNTVSSGAACLALGGSRDVVMIDAHLDGAEAIDEAPPELMEAYAQQADWDPRSSGGSFVLLLLRPHRVQVWREADEIDGRTVMRDGRWIV